MKNEQLISKNKATTTLTSTSTRRVETIPLRDAANCIQWFANGPGSDVVNFPFALTVSMFLIAGLSAAVWGLFLTNVPLAAIGAFITLAGSFLCGLSRYET